MHITKPKWCSRSAGPFLHVTGVRFPCRSLFAELSGSSWPLHIPSSSLAPLGHSDSRRQPNANALGMLFLFVLLTQFSSHLVCI